MPVKNDPHSSQKRGKKGRIIAGISAILLLGFFLAYFIAPITFIDAPWHLKTGQYIIEQREIPFKDPFLHTTEGLQSPREEFLMTQYWLAQVIFAVIHKEFGFAGLAFLNALILSSACLLMWSAFLRKGLLPATLIVIILAPVLMEYSGFRPQVFSLFFTVLVSVIINGYLEEGRKSRLILFIPFIMIVWANMHAGFLFGNLIILCSAVPECLNALRPETNPLQKSRARLFCLISLVALLASYLNPNGFSAIEAALNPDWFAAHSGRKVLEYYSLLELFYVSPFVRKEHFLFWILLAYVLIMIVLSAIRRNARSRDIVLTACALFMTIGAMRYMPFLLLGVLPAVVKYDLRIPVGSHWTKALTVLGLIVTTLLLSSIGSSITSLRGNKDYSFDFDQRNPAKAVQFILNNDISGKVFNGQFHGGYLIYNLFPMKFFVDSRALYPHVVAESYAIEDALRFPDDRGNLLYALLDSSFFVYPNLKIKVDDQTVSAETGFAKSEYWKDLLSKYGVEIIICRACDPLNGRIYPIALRMVRDDLWALIYVDGETMIFVRQIPRFQDLIAKYGKDKGYVFDEIMVESLRLGNRSLASLAFALTMTGNSEKGIELAKTALEIDGNDIVASFSKAVLMTKEASARK